MDGEEPPFFAEREIPPANLAKYYANREEELELLQRRTDQRVGTLTIIEAPPKHGKSTLLSAYAASKSSAARPVLGLNLQRLLPSRPPHLRRRIYERLLHIVQPDAPPSPALDLAADEAWLALRRRLPKQGLVLLLDDVEAAITPSLDALAPLLHLTGRERIHLILATSRPLPDHPLLESARHVALAPWGSKESVDFLQSRLARASLEATSDFLQLCWDHSGGVPYHLQLIGLKAWEYARLSKEITLTVDHFPDILSRALDVLPPEITGVLSVVSGEARDALAAMAVHGATSPTAIARLIGVEPKNAVVLLTRLAEGTGAVTKVDRGAYRITNRLLEAYLKRHYANPEF